MWLICFQPIGSDRLVPQLLCNSEQEAKDWVKNAPFSVVGSYIYMFVPLNTPVGYFKRQEPYQFPAYQEVYPYYLDDNSTAVPQRRPWQIAIGDWPGQPPQTNC